MGRSSELTGRAFELRLNAQCAELPMWVKIPTDKRARGGVWLDYVGALPGGRCVTADAKWRPNATRLTPGVLKPHQRAFAEAAHRAGVLTCVIVGWVQDGTVAQAVVPWPAVVAGADRDDWRCESVGQALIDMAR